MSENSKRIPNANIVSGARTRQRAKADSHSTSPEKSPVKEMMPANYSHQVDAGMKDVSRSPSKNQQKTYLRKQE